MKTEAQRIWDTALGELQLQVSKSNYTTLFEKTQGVSFEQDRFTVAVPNTFVSEYLEKNQRSLIEKTLARLVHRDVEVVFQINVPTRVPEGVPVAPYEMPAPAFARGMPLNPRYTFEAFIEGGSNKLACEAAQKVAESPGQAYNPLFLYGGPGLGKTHLLHSIGHVAMAKSLRVLYVTAEQFTNEFITSIRAGRSEDFRNKFRHVDVFLMDDVHFISGKEGTEESLFHTFNDLHNANRQIAITSDRPPQSMPLLQERLRSRFAGGLIADVQPPDFETRLAILQVKAEQKEVRFSPDTLEFIAQHIQQNIRELEGALNRVVAYSRLLRAAITPELTAHAIEDLANRTPRGISLTPASVIEAVATSFEFSPLDLTGKKRDKETSLARQVAVYVLKSEMDCSLVQIGKELGGRNPSTMTHAYQKIASAIDDNPYLKGKLDDIRQRLRSAGGTGLAKH